MQKMNELYKNGWSALPRSVFISPDDRLNAMARLVLMCLLAHRNDVTGLCNPSQHTIARECGISVRSVGDALRLLIDTAYIAVDETIKGRTNAYVFVFEIPHPSQSTSALHADMGRVSQTSALCADKQQNNSIVVINNTTTCEQPVTRCSGNDLIFDCNLHNAEPAFISFATALLEGIPDAQKILDELNFQIGEKKQQGTPIRNLQGYLVKLAKLNATSEFIPSGALEIAARRTARNARKPVAATNAPKPVQTEVKTPNQAAPEKLEAKIVTKENTEKEISTVGRSHLDAMRKKLGMQPKESESSTSTTPVAPKVLSDEEKQAIRAGLVNMASGQRGGTSFQSIGKIIRGNHEA